MYSEFRCFQLFRKKLAAKKKKDEGEIEYGFFFFFKLRLDYGSELCSIFEFSAPPSIE